MLRLIDSHCHLNFEGFKEDRDLILEQSLETGIGIINVGSQYETSLEAVKLAKKYKRGVWAVVGLHPIHVGKRLRDEMETKFQKEVDQEGPERIFEEIKGLLGERNDRIVGIGESGLDYFHLPEEKRGETKEGQADFFKRQILLAREQNLPLVIHCRDAYQDLIKILKQEKVTRGVVHCFSGTWEEAKEVLNLGLYLGFTGIITFRNAKELQEIVRQVPLEKVLLETDAPYLAPEPYRGKRNLPSYAQLVAEKIAELKNLPKEKVFKQTLKNTIKLFDLMVK